MLLEPIGNKRIKARIDAFSKLVLDNKDKTWYICSHDNPDPDSIASSLGIKRILNFLGVESTKIVYCGEISHPQNRALVNVLQLRIDQWEGLTEDNDCMFVFVDCSAGQKNMSIKKEPAIVVDHHKITTGKKDILFLHDEVGACSTLVLDLALSLTKEVAGDLENITNEAALIAIRKNKDKIDMSDFEESRDIILMGHVREETISEAEKKITAYHEAGHALVAWHLPGTDPIHKVSIIPRGLAMGVTQLLPEEDRHYYPKTYLMNRLSVALAGRVSEKIVFNDVSSGAQSDLKEATDLAEKMVSQWGMSDKVGPVNLGRGEEHPFLGRELAQPKRYSEEMAWLMDQEIRELISEAEKQAEKVLTENRQSLVSLADALIKEEVLERKDIERIIKQSS